MNATDTSIGLRPAGSELVLLRYAVRVSEIDVLIVSEGVPPRRSAGWR